MFPTYKWCVLVMVLCGILSYFVLNNVPAAAVQQISFRPASQPALPPPPRPPPPPSRPCTCQSGSSILKDHIPKEQYEAVAQRRAKELRQHRARTSSVMSTLLFAAPNSPLQYPIQGFVVRPLTPSVIPGLRLSAGERSSYEVCLNVSRGTLNTQTSHKQATVKGAGSALLSIESSSLAVLNELLSTVSYTSSVYHINTGDLASFRFEGHEAVFAIAIRQPQVPVLYDMGTDLRSQVTVVTKTFIRYPQLHALLDSIRQFYPDILVVVADDSFEPKSIDRDNVEQYVMPPAQGWFAGRNLAVSQVTTKYLLWVDDDFLFTQETKIEKLVEVMEANPELDMVGGSVAGNKFPFVVQYEEGTEEEGGCLIRKSGGKFRPLPGYPQCSLTQGVVNFFLARTDAVRRVGFDPQLNRVAHSEFFMDGLGQLMIATCDHVVIAHQVKTSVNSDYSKFRNPTRSGNEAKLQLHFFKNHLKCIRYA